MQIDRIAHHAGARLKAADIGVAVGSGTDVTKETADLVLLDDNFKTIVSSVEGGRTIFENIRKVMLYLLSDSFLEIILVGGSVLIGLPLPVTAAQILWINLIEDSLPAVSLAFEKGEGSLMKRKPRRLTDSILDREMKTYIFVIGLVNNILLFGIYFFFLNRVSIVHTHSVVFAALAMNSLFFVFSCRSFTEPIWKRGIFSNRFLIGAFVYGMAMLVAALHLPWLQKLLRTEGLSLNEWGVIVVLATVPLIVVEMIKGIYNRKRFAL